MSDILESMVEVKLAKPDDFLKVKETLTRIGVASRKEKILYQSCHILHKKNKYYIVHFKQMFVLDGKPTDFSESDIARRNTIANLLAEWGLVTIIDSKSTSSPTAPMSQIKIVAHKEKDDWKLIPKYSIGKR